MPARHTTRATTKAVANTKVAVVTEKTAGPRFGNPSVVVVDMAGEVEAPRPMARDQAVES